MSEAHVIIIEAQYLVLHDTQFVSSCRFRGMSGNVYSVTSTAAEVSGQPATKWPTG